MELPGEFPDRWLHWDQPPAYEAPQVFKDGPIHILLILNTHAQQDPGPPYVHRLLVL